MRIPALVIGIILLLAGALISAGVLKFETTEQVVDIGPIEVNRTQERQAPLNLSFADTFHGRQADAYERLLMDVVRGNPMLFMRSDEVEAAWRWAEPILAAWTAQDEAPKPYNAGSWGPSAAIGLIERDGRNWHEDMR